MIGVYMFRIYCKIILISVLLLSIPSFSFAERKDSSVSLTQSWQPYGETVAGPKEINPSIQAVERSSGDGQIPYKYRKDSQLRPGDNRGFIYYGIVADNYRDKRLSGPITPSTLHEHVNYKSDSNVRRKDVFIYTD